MNLSLLCSKAQVDARGAMCFASEVHIKGSCSLFAHGGVVAGAPLKKRRIVGARDPLKGGFSKAGRAGQGKMTEAELAASRIKVKVRPRKSVTPALSMAPSSQKQIWSSRASVLVKSQPWQLFWRAFLQSSPSNTKGVRW